VPIIYQEELTCPHFFQIALTLAPAAIDASEFSFFRNFDWFPMFHKKLKFSFQILVYLLFSFFSLYLLSIRAMFSAYYIYLAEIIFYLDKNKDFTVLHFAVLSFAIRAEVLSLSQFFRGKTFR
jgi:hypothetical protein